MLLVPILAGCLAVWVLSARLNYAYMVRHNWLRQVKQTGRYVYSSWAHCPNVYKFFHVPGRSCPECRRTDEQVNDWGATRNTRFSVSLILGPVLLPVALTALVITGKQPVQNEELQDRVARAEAELEEATRKANNAQN